MSGRIDLDDGWQLWPVAAVRGAGMPFDWLTGPAGEGVDADGLRALLDEPWFQSALAWQNPGVSQWAARPGVALTSYRLGVLARYAQRYCAKNDSIGFFGPVGWSTLTGGPGAAPVVSGGALLRDAEASLELWAVRALAAHWAADERIRPHVPLRRDPSVWLDGGCAYRPHRAPLPLDAAACALLDRVAATPGLTEAALPAAERGALPRLLAEQVLIAGFRLPPGAHPERDLRAELTRLPDGDAREAAVGALDTLIDQLTRAEKAVTRPAGLTSALDALHDTFTGITGGPAQRTRAEAGAGRTVAYVDCRRDTDVELPAGLTAGLAAPLSLLLRSARWLTSELRAAVDEHLTGVYARLRATRPLVTLAELHLAAADVLTGQPGTPAEAVGEDFRLRWAEVLDAGPGPVRYAAADLERMVDLLFGAERPGWAAARQHSPDLLLATGDGPPLWVLGELHVAMNTLESRFFHTLADDPGQLSRLTAEDMAGGRVVPRYPYGPQIDSRRYPPLAVHLDDRYLTWAPGADMGEPGGGVLPAAGLVVYEGAGELTAGPRDGSWRLPVAEFFGEYLSAITVNLFRMPGPGPRITVDDLVIRRAGWSFAPDAMPAAALGNGGYRPEVLCRFLTDRGLPRHLFATVPGEPKPFYVDLHTPALVTNLARSWRRAGAGPVTLGEMLPGPDQLWLRDRAGHRYTTEFRMVAVDPQRRDLPLPREGRST